VGSTRQQGPNERAAGDTASQDGSATQSEVERLGGVSTIDSCSAQNRRDGQAAHPRHQVVSAGLAARRTLRFDSTEGRWMNSALLSKDRRCGATSRTTSCRTRVSAHWFSIKTMQHYRLLLAVFGGLLAVLLTSPAPVMGDVGPTGAFQTSVAIKVPPFHGLEPRLGLSYSSSHPATRIRGSKAVAGARGLEPAKDTASRSGADERALGGSSASVR
jgi:hypothetical protein